MNFTRKSLLSIVVLTTITACGGGSEGTKKDENIEIITPPEASNASPISNAGSDITLDLGDTVTLDGSASTDTDGDDLSFTWTVENAPVSNMNIESVVYPSFTPDVEGVYEISLTVNDGKASSEKDYVEVTVIKPNSSPIAVINGLGFGKQGEVYYLDANLSNDADGDVLSYKWAFKSLPENSLLSDSGLEPAPQIQFTPDQPGEYEIELIVNDGIVDSESVTHLIFIEENASPTVTAISDLNFNLGGEAYIYSRVEDTDSTEFTYSWEITGAPAGSELIGFTGTNRYLTYIPDLPGNYIAKVTVNDGFNSVESELVTATISPKYEYEHRIGGTDQYYGKVNERVLIDFAKSDSPGGNELEYSWTVSSGPNGSRPSLSRSIVDKAETEFKGDKAGFYRLRVTMKDGDNITSKYVYVRLYGTDENMMPSSQSSNPHFIKLGDEILLNGASSFDSENDVLSYFWEEAYQPPTSQLKLKDTNNVNHTLKPTVPGFYNFRLQADDSLSSGYSRDSAWFYVYEQLTPTVAFTENEITAQEGTQITLDGSKSIGVDESVTIAWDLINAPYNSTSEITNRESLTPSFHLDVDGKFIFQLRLIKDNQVVSIEHLTVRSYENAVPVAEAGEDISAQSGENVQLSAEKSFDNDDETLSYHWRIIGLNSNDATKPSLLNHTSEKVTLVTDENYVGQVIVGLTVSDGNHESKRDEIIVNYEGQ